MSSELNSKEELIIINQTFALVNIVKFDHRHLLTGFIGLGDKVHCPSMSGGIPMGSRAMGGWMDAVRNKEFEEKNLIWVF